MKTINNYITEKLQISRHKHSFTEMSFEELLDSPIWDKYSKIFAKDIYGNDNLPKMLKHEKTAEPFWGAQMIALSVDTEFKSMGLIIQVRPKHMQDVEIDIKDKERFFRVFGEDAYNELCNYIQNLEYESNK